MALLPRRRLWPSWTGWCRLRCGRPDAVLRAHLGLGPTTSLTGRALGLYEAADPIELQHRFTRRSGYGRPELVRMSPALLDEADRGDAVARQIVTAAGNAMGGQGRVSAERIGLDMAGTAVVMGGGLFQHPSAVLAEAVMGELPGAVPKRTTLPHNVIGQENPGSRRVLHGAAVDHSHAGHPRRHLQGLPRRRHLQLHEPGQHRVAGGVEPLRRQHRVAVRRTDRLPPACWPATTRAEGILADVPSYWAHYRDQAQSDDPELDPSRSRGGIHELELAIDCMDAVFNDRDEVMMVNVANGGTLDG